MNLIIKQQHNLPHNSRLGDAVNRGGHVHYHTFPEDTSISCRNAMKKNAGNFANTQQIHLHRVAMYLIVT